ncbi:unnamed protein product [Trichogramma brassicae]|uniref:Uncharacterized protein n=1 Tax=Trichogramma brassicae TaxID=86971 RepID=A0A6H5J2Q0_9HYME|nr:unnamed protein product [Trichogramma brassicae]
MKLPYLIPILTCKDNSSSIRFAHRLYSMRPRKQQARSFFKYIMSFLQDNTNCRRRRRRGRAAVALGRARVLVGFLVVAPPDHGEVRHLEGVGLLAATLEGAGHAVAHVEVARRDVGRQEQLRHEIDRERDREHKRTTEIIERAKSILLWAI